LEGLFNLPAFFVRKRVAFISDSYSLRMEQVAKADETEDKIKYTHIVSLYFEYFCF
jgi:hypothetical protein